MDVLLNNQQKELLKSAYQKDSVAVTDDNYFLVVSLLSSTYIKAQKDVNKNKYIAFQLLSNGNIFVENLLEQENKEKQANDIEQQNSIREIENLNIAKESLELSKKSLDIGKSSRNWAILATVISLIGVGVPLFLHFC